MSRWLKNVGQFLEKLDVEAERVVDERLDVGRSNGDEAIASILASRGLQQTDSKEEDISEDEEEEEVAVLPGDSENEAVEDNVLPDGSEAELVSAQAKKLASHELSATSEKGMIEVVVESNEENDVPESGLGESETSLKASQKKESEGATIESSLDSRGEALYTPSLEKTGAPKQVENSGQQAPTSEGSYSVASLSTELTRDDSMEAVSLRIPEQQEMSLENDSPKRVPFVESKNQSDTLSSQQLREAPNETRSVMPRTESTSQPDPRASQQLQQAEKRAREAQQQAREAQTQAQETQQQAREAQKQIREVQKEAREAQKEARTLKKHVVSLHSQLESAETEMQAQRAELEKAAERMEKDRIRSKQERETEKSRHAAEIDLLKKNHEQSQKDAKRQADALLEDVRAQLRELEQKRTQEGGNWDKELTEAVTREQELVRRLAMTEDEKETLLSHISTLQEQQEALGSRLDSLTQTADNAMAREREADERLDEALSLHARQIALRNTREAELEKTVAELGAALVAARGKGDSGSTDQTPGDSTYQSSPEHSLREGFESELEVVRTQLVHERERNHALQRELKEVTKERTDEVTLTKGLQLQFDRKAAEMAQEISRLKRELQQAKESANSFHGNLSGISEDANQIKQLSEEVLRQREIIVNCNSDISALKSRLRVSLHRTEQAEAAAEMANRSPENLSDIELGSGRPVRRRGGRTADGLRGSMKAALQLDSFDGEGTKRLGKSLDALDNFLAKSGTVLRYNPIARLFFIVYLLLLHSWTFVLLFYHTHGFDSANGNYGAGATLPHGPQALLRQEIPGQAGTVGN